EQRSYARRIERGRDRDIQCDHQRFGRRPHSLHYLEPDDQCVASTRFHTVGFSIKPDRQSRREWDERYHDRAERRFYRRRGAERERIAERRYCDVQPDYDNGRERHANAQRFEYGGRRDNERDDQWLRRRTDALYHTDP